LKQLLNRTFQRFPAVSKEDSSNFQRRHITFAKTGKLISFENEEEILTLIRQKLTTYRVTLTMSLQSLTVFVSPFSESKMFSFAVLNAEGVGINILAKDDDLASRVEVMHSTMKELDILVRRAKGNSAPIPGSDTSRYIDNLEGCSTSAKKLLAAASSVVTALTDTSSAVGTGPAASEFGFVFTDNQKSGVENWLFEPTTYDLAENEDDAETGDPSDTNASQTEPTLDNFMMSRSGVETVDTKYMKLPAKENTGEESDSDIEPEFIEFWQKKGRQKLHEGQFSEAASYLEKALMQGIETRSQ
jgi:hypothetical protein